MEPKAAKDGKDGKNTSQQGSPKVVYLRSEASVDLVDNFDSLGYVKSALAAKYEVLNEIAKTETSAVYRAVHVQLGREVALRVLLRSTAQDRAYVDLFHRRSRAVDKLSQSNIIRIYDEGVESGIHYVATEFLKGITLDNRISQQGPLPYDVMLGLMMPAVSGLRHAHHNSIVHGNINCSSIFLHGDGRIILKGFGIQSGQVNSRPIFRRAAGSMEYLSPEEAAGDGSDARSDIYSLGVVMYHALTGKFPYSEDTPEATAQAIMSGIYMPVSDYIEIPQWLGSVVDRCLQNDLTRRVQSCAELMVLFNASSTVDSENFTIAEMNEESQAREEPPVFESSHSEEPAAPGPDPPLVKAPEVAGAHKTPEHAGTTVPGPRPTASARPELLKSSRPPAEPEKIPSKRREPVKAPKSDGHILAWSLAAAILVLAAGTAYVMHSLQGAETRQKVVSQEASSSKPDVSQEPASPDIVDNREAAQSPEEGVSEKEVKGQDRKEEANAEKTVSAPPAIAEHKDVAPPPATKAKISRSQKNSATMTPPVNKREMEVSRKAESVNQPVAAEEQTGAVYVTLPDLTGIQLRVAKTILSLNGLILGQTTTVSSPGKEDLVISQVPKAGTRLKKGSRVNLIVGSR